ncbi:hypothetical protein L7F22_014806 [Adiantum nelumboides]|nr:hypothetical protein [Adiantum nelumboides]
MERLRASLCGYGGPIFATEADRIMSRYRPIAPKPALPCVSDVERSASSAIIIDNLTVRQVPDSSTTPSKQKSKRVRKRSLKEAEGQLQPAKRPALDGLSSQVGHKLQSFPCGLATEASPMLIQEDAGFMERAAASAPPSMFPLEKTRKSIQNNSYGYGGCFTELIRGIAGLPTANHVHNLLQHQQQQQQLPSLLEVLPQHCSVGQRPKQCQDESQEQRLQRETRETRDELCSDAFWSCFTDGDPKESVRERATSEEGPQSGLDEEGMDGESDQRKGIVTLNLLPEVPTRAESPTQSTSSCGSSHASAHCMSLARMERVYGHSPEPVILTDNKNYKVLWVNQSYSKACKGNSNMLLPFIHPLGAPMQLGQFQLQLESHSESTSATLWGFLKKFVVDMANRNASKWLSSDVSTAVHNASVESRSGLPTLPQPYSLGMSNWESSDTLNSPRVITPQPVRLVGSMVSVESLAEIQNGNVVAASLELVKKQSEEGKMPGFITDTSNVVRWVNSAYKVMVGQPECPWLASTMREEGGCGAPTITGEVLLTCNVEVPTSVVSFSGRANVQWTKNTGERSCMTLPCDVSAFVDGYSKRMLVWKLDAQASLSLTCGAKSLA